jgi:hypothetical protein
MKDVAALVDVVGWRRADRWSHSLYSRNRQLVHLYVQWLLRHYFNLFYFSAAQTKVIKLFSLFPQMNFINRTLSSRFLSCLRLGLDKGDLFFLMINAEWSWLNYTHESSSTTGHFFRLSSTAPLWQLIDVALWKDVCCWCDRFPLTTRKNWHVSGVV